MLLRSLAFLAVASVTLGAHPAMANRPWPFAVSYPSAHPASDSDIAAIVSLVSHRKARSYRIVRLQFQSPLEAQVFMKDGELLTLHKRHDRWFIDPSIIGSWEA